jgi:glycosyltransferase involved in cell wall biosynthesis
MAMGKAIIAADVPLVQEFITAGETGLVVPPGDAAALRAAITGLLERPEEQRRLGRNARRYLEEQLSMAAFADRFAVAIRRAAAFRGA